MGTNTAVQFKTKGEAFLVKESFLLHDNACPHVAHRTQDLIGSFGSEIIYLRMGSTTHPGGRWFFDYVPLGDEATQQWNSK